MGLEQENSLDSPQIHHQIQTIFKKFETAVIHATSITPEDVFTWTGQVGETKFTYSTNELIIPFGVWRGQNDSLIICLPTGSVEIHRYPGPSPRSFLTDIKTREGSIIFETDRQTGIPFSDSRGLAKAINLKPILESLLTL